MTKQINQKKKSSKKNLISKKGSSSLTYINGTNTDRETAIKHLNLSKFDKKYNVAVTDGVGTLANTKREKKLRSINNTEKQGHLVNLFSNLKDNFNTVQGSILGYGEATHLANSKTVFKALKNDPKKMVLAGHSRGAAVGITGVITEMYAEACLIKKKGEQVNTDFLKNIDKIAIVALDPVMGLDTNDHMGLKRKLDSNAPSISEMLNTISEVSKKPDLFDVTVVLARHDGRGLFKIDPRWEEFHTLNAEKKCDVYHASFQHSDMVFDNELNNESLPTNQHTATTDIYDHIHKPTELVNAILAQKLLPENSSLELKQKRDQKVAKLANEIQEAELKEIDKVQNNQQSKLPEYTSGDALLSSTSPLITNNIKKNLAKNIPVVNGREIKGINKIRTNEQKQKQAGVKFIIPERRNFNNTQKQKTEATTNLNFNDMLKSSAIRNNNNLKPVVPKEPPVSKKKQISNKI